MNASEFLESSSQVASEFIEKDSASEFLDGGKPTITDNVLAGAWETTKNIGRVYPVLETAANLVTQVYGLPVSGLAGLVGTLVGGSETGEDWLNKTAETLIYQPQTKGGQQVTEAALAPITELEKAAQKAGDKVFDKTQSAAAATAAYTAIMGAPMALGLKGKKGGKPKVAKEVIKDVETKHTQQRFAERFLEEPEPVKVTEIPPKIVEQVKQETVKQEPAKPDLLEIAKKVEPQADQQALVSIAKMREKSNLPPDIFDKEIMNLANEGKVWLHRHADPSVAKPEAVVKSGKDTYMGIVLREPGPPKAPPSTKLYSGLPVDQVLGLHKKVGETVWDNWVMDKAPKLLEKVPGGKAINRALLYDYRGDLPKTADYMKTMEEMHRGKNIGREYAIDLGNRLQSFPEESQMRVGEFIRGERTNLPSSEIAVAQEAKNAMLVLGRKAVDTGLLSEETFFKHAGKYMPRLYTSKEYQSLLTKFNIREPARLDLSRFKNRKDIPKEIRQEMGEILTPGYPIAKGVAQLTHDIETAKFFNKIAENPDWSVSRKTKVIPDGWMQLPSNKKLGRLSESYVHPEIFADLQETIRIMGTPERVWRKALGSWKFGKVILSPKTHARNLLSNSVLAHLGGMPMPVQPVYLSRAAKAMRNKGEYWRMAKEEGLLSETFTNAELRTLFDQVELQMKGIKPESLPDRFGKIGGVWQKSKSTMNKAAKIYEAEEQWFKMAKFIHNIEKRKMSPIMAAADAEKWLFNYSKVTKFQDKYRTKWYGAPFATFTFKAMPRIAEAAIKYPWRFVLPGAMIWGLEEAARRKFGDTPKQRNAKRELLPEWMQGHMMGMPNFARMPFADEDGREYYLNLTYILPWGDIAESGGFGPIPGGLMPMSQPFVKEPMSQIMNYDPFWEEEIVKETDLAGKDSIGKAKTQVEKRGKHLAQTLVPTPVIDITKAIDAFKREPDYRGRLKPVRAVAADVLAGIKMYPVDYAEQAARLIEKNNPEKGWLARKIKGEIETLAVKANTIKKRGGNANHYEKKIQEKIRQLFGLAEETKETSEAYRKTK